MRHNAMLYATTPDVRIIALDLHSRRTRIHAHIPDSKIGALNRLSIECRKHFYFVLSPRITPKYLPNRKHETRCLSPCAASHRPSAHATRPPHRTRERSRHLISCQKCRECHHFNARSRGLVPAWFHMKAGMKTPPTTLRAMKPRYSPESTMYQSLNGILSGVSSRNR